MRFFVFVIIALFFSSSCTSYQYYQLQSSLSEVGDNQFEYESDSIVVSYSFEGSGGPLQIEMYNKLDKPIEVDWSASALIVGEKSFTYWRDESSVNLDHFQYNTTGTIVRPSPDSFIPPRASIVVRLDKVNPHAIQLKSGYSFETVNFQGIVTRKYEFSKEDSPISFRSYLTLSTGGGIGLCSLDHSFWVSEIYESMTKSSEGKIPGEGFYTSSATGAGAVLGVVTGVGVVWLAIAVEQ